MSVSPNGGLDTARYGYKRGEPGPDVEVLRMVGVRVDHPGRAGVLQGISLHVDAGEIVVVEGRSGSGKSSLLGVAGGLAPAAAGQVWVAGESMDARDAAGSARLRSKQVGLVFQQLNLLDELTVQENVELPLRLHHFDRAAGRIRVSELLAHFGLEALAARRPATLSGGEQQRVAIARALAVRPALLLVDEPTSSLDETNAKQVASALRQAAAEGAGVLLATHDRVLRGLGRLLRLDDGRLWEPKS